MPQRTAADVCQLFRLSEAGRLLMSDGDTPQSFFGRLRDAGQLADARRLLAHCLPPRRAVWWASLCLQESLRHKPFINPLETAAYEAALKWLVEPTEEHRREAARAGWKAKPSTAGGNLAMAAFLSSGSMSKPGLPPVYPKPHLCGRLCGVVVYLASVRYDPAHYKAHLEQYLQIGHQVASGQLPLPTPESELPATEPTALVGQDELAKKLAEFLSSQPGAGV